MAAMEPVTRPVGANLRVIWIVTFIVLVVVGGMVAVVVTFVLGMFHLMDRTDAHVCGLAAVRRSPVADALLGTPIRQQGLTGGSTSSENGELTQRITFTVAGPRGSASVVSEGRRSPLASHLLVKLGSDERAQTIYSGPFDCPELHR